MKKLHNDISRCAGKQCAERGGCARYLQLVQDVERRPKSPVQRYSVAISMRDGEKCHRRIAA